MEIIVIGLSHKTAPINVRERFYLQPLERQLLLSELKNNPAVAEAVVLSTCNRTEIYLHVVTEEPIENYVALLARIKKIPKDEEIMQYFYAHSGAMAVDHLLRVAAGIESLVIGERQIMGQIKDAVEIARVSGMMQKTFNILTNIAIRTGKRVQNETHIGDGGVSVSWAAVSMAINVFGTLKDKSVLILGAGKMSKLAVNHLHNKGIGHIYVMNRTHEKAQDLALEYNGEAVPFCDIKDVLTKVDICICSAGAPHYLIDKTLAQKVMSLRQKKLLLIDVSVPRNIDPAVMSIPNVSLVVVDDLNNVVQDNLQARMQSVNDVEKIVLGKIKEFYLKVNKHPALEGRALVLSNPLYDIPPFKEISYRG